MIAVVDSSVLVAAFREQEPHSREAFRILKLIERGDIEAVIPVSVLLEVVAAIRRRTGSSSLSSEISGWLLSLKSLTLVELTVGRINEMIDYAATSGLTGMDVAVVGIARAFNLPLVTLDQEMAAIASESVQVLDISKV